MSSAHKKNFYISYLKWIAIISIILVHLINWSEMAPSSNTISYYLRDMLHIWLLFFITLSGSLIIIAYGKYESLKKPTIKLLKRSFLLLFIYFTYSIIKYYIYNFNKEPFFLQFVEKWTMNLVWILSFQSFSVPITVLVLWSMFLALTPIILYINKTRYKKSILLWIIAFFTVMNYFTVIPRNAFTEILYWENNVLFSFNLWVLPYLIWIYLGMIWFQKKKKEILMFFGITSLTFLLFQLKDNLPYTLDSYMYPLKPYYISISFFAMFVFVYFFIWLEKKWNKKIDYILSLLKFLWDNTLFIFIWHWIVIDLTIWLFHPNIWTIWITVILFIAIYTYYYRTKITKNIEELNVFREHFKI